MTRPWWPSSKRRGSAPRSCPPAAPGAERVASARRPPSVGGGELQETGGGWPQITGAVHQRRPPTEAWGRLPHDGAEALRRPGQCLRQEGGAGPGQDEGDEGVALGGLDGDLRVDAGVGE